MNKLTFGSVCSGIEAARVAFPNGHFNQLWSSEIEPFPCKVLDAHYPNTANLGDMLGVEDMIMKGYAEPPDILCGGTPCQSFSLVGLKKGLQDDRGKLTMHFIRIADAIDRERLSERRDNALLLWENVPGILNLKGNPFGNFLSALGGYRNVLTPKKWDKSGYLEGPKRNIAWRILDSKYFGLPQERRRLYVVAGGKDFDAKSVLFEEYGGLIPTYSVDMPYIFSKEGVEFEVFRKYTSCLLASYSNKWNGNAAAYNGSLFLSEDGRLRRLTPSECESLMGFPKGYTDIKGGSYTARYRAIGNSWAVPVIRWIAQRLLGYIQGNLGYLDNNTRMNMGESPNNPFFGDIREIIEPSTAPDNLYISAKSCEGLIRRKGKRNMNPRLEKMMVELIKQQK